MSKDPSDVELDAAQTSADTEAEGVDLPQEAEAPIAEAEEWIGLGGDESLTVAEANDVAAERRATVILVAGEYEAGKTTLLVELYARFLHGPFHGWNFAGSRTLMAFDKRHFPTRHASRLKRPVTERTEEEDMRLLHLRLVRLPQEAVLMPSDIRGEFFEHIIDGAGVAEQVPLAARADKTIVLVDGARVADPYQRQEAILRTRLLIGGLTEEGGIPMHRPMAIVLAKTDLINDEGVQWFDVQAKDLAEFATLRGAEPTVHHVAARPDDSPDEPRQLEGVLDWMVEHHLDGPSSFPPLHVTRQFWRLGLDES